MIFEKESIDAELEEELKCPITFQKMKEPVNIQTGHTFQKKAIRKWINKSSKSPLSGVILESKTLTQNILIKRTIQNYDKMLTLPLQMLYRHQESNKIKPIYCLMQQINLYYKQISDIVGIKTTQETFRSQLQCQEKHKQQMKELVQKQKNYILQQKNYIMNLNVDQQNKGIDKIYFLAQIFDGLEQEDIQNLQIYTQLTQQQINYIKSFTSYAIRLSQNAYKLYIQFQFQLDALIKHNWPEVQYLKFQDIHIDTIQLKTFLQVIHTAFPNLKILTFSQCNQFGDQGWKLIIQSIGNLRHIQCLILQQNKIANVTFNELTQLDKIEGLKYFSIKHNRQLTRQSRFNLRRFKAIHSFPGPMYYA